MRFLGQLILKAYDAFDRRLVGGWLVCMRLAQRITRILAARGAPLVRRLLRACAPIPSRAWPRVAGVFQAVHKHIPTGLYLALAALLTAGFGSLFGRAEHARVLIFLRFPDYEIPRVLAETSVLGLLITIARLGTLVTGLGIIAAVMAAVRFPIGLWALRMATSALAMLVVFLHMLVWHAPATLHAADPDLFAGHMRNEVWVQGSLMLLLPALATLLFLFVLTLRSTAAYYRMRQSVTALLGDRIWRNVRTGGRDPRFRKAQYASIFLHIFVILILPFLLTWSGCRVDFYGVPKGSGVTAVQVVRVVQQQEKQEEKRYVFDRDTAISFYVPKIDESEVFDEVALLTQHTYSVQQTGALGEGGGTTGGWPHGMEDARVRFIRLQYDGGSWDQNMGYGADYNMLLVFRQITGFNIWHETESIRVPQLRRFVPRRAPPFVYMTGGVRGGINMSNAEIRALREYCLNMGGMILADNGGGRFDRDFRAIMRQAFPDLPMVEIPHDDTIFQAPFRFPSGAPPLWHLSGTQAMGIRHQGRWVVFYHQGHMGAAWRDGHSGAQPHVVSQAYQMGVNIIAYAFNQYMRINFGGRIPR